jgi:SAM-dependent methyltransferase
MSLKPLLYRTFIDPLLSSVRAEVVRNIAQGEQVIDIACGNGTLAVEMSAVAGEVTAIDLDPEMLWYAASRKDMRNRHIILANTDASNLSTFTNKQFDTAVTTMSIHQFDPVIAHRVLSEMKRVANRIIIADYNIPLPRTLAGLLASGIERMAGGDHYRNFRNFRSIGGLKHFIKEAGLELISSEIRGGGVFVVEVLQPVEREEEA